MLKMPKLKVCICAVLMYVFTNWPWKTVVKIMQIGLIKPTTYERTSDRTDERMSERIPLQPEADNDEADDFEPQADHLGRQS